MDKRATLILPDEVALNGADVDLHPAIEIVWDEDEPVTVDVLRPRGSDGRPQAPMVVGSWKIYDAEGKEVEQAMAQMVWASPDGKLDVAKGSRAKLPFEPNSLYVLSKARAGRYYATAEFSGIFRGAKVRFVTDNRWFTIIREH